MSDCNHEVRLSGSTAPSGECVAVGRLASPNLRYVLVTPARNEAEFIAQTAESVVGQTIRPVKWVVVSDGSTDRTDEIVKAYADRHGWIELVRLPERAERHFAGKVFAFNAGYERVRALPFDIVGNLDADISFDPDYFAFLLERFEEDGQLGVAGTPFREDELQYDFRFASTNHVSGACQLFRRACFDAIGGYQPVKGGGIDWIAVTTARMLGWRTTTFTERHCRHHRRIGTARGSVLSARFRQGHKDYCLGGDPLWQIFRCAYQTTRVPRVLGGAAMMAGYFWGFLSRSERPVSTELLEFHRNEQRARLRALMHRSNSRNQGTPMPECGDAGNNSTANVPGVTDVPGQRLR